MNTKLSFYFTDNYLLRPANPLTPFRRYFSSLGPTNRFGTAAFFVSLYTKTLVMRNMILLLLLYVGNYQYCQESGITFQKGTWEDAQLLAKQSDKPLFIFAYSPGCHFCKKMETSVFPNKRVTAYYNTTFVNYKLNLEKGQGLELAKKYDIKAFPTYVYFDKEGNLLHISGAEKSADDFIQDGKNAFDSGKAYSALKTRYDNGERSPDLLYNFTTALRHSNTKSDLLDQINTEYLHSQAEKDIISKKNLDYILNESSSLDAPATPYFFKYYGLLLQSYGPKEIREKTRWIIGRGANDAGLQKDSMKLFHLVEFPKAINMKDKDQWIALANVKYKLGIFLGEKNEWLPYADAALAYGQKYAVLDHSTGVEAATYLYYFTESNKSLKKAVRLVDQDIAIDPGYDNTLLRARLLHKMGQDSNAIICAKKAITLAAEKKEDDSDAKDLINEIKNPEKKINTQHTAVNRMLSSRNFHPGSLVHQTGC